MTITKGLPDLSEFGRSIQIAGAVYSDGRENFALMLPGEVARQTSCSFHHLDLEGWLALLEQVDSVPVEALVKDAHGKVGLSTVRKCERQISQHVSWEVFRRDHFTCRYCGDDTSPLTVDHLVTWESGGPTEPANLLASCKKCNAARGDTPYAEWIDSVRYLVLSTGGGHGPGILGDWDARNRALIATLDDIRRVPLKDGKRRGKR